MTGMDGKTLLTLFMFAIPLLAETCELPGILTKHFGEKLNSIP